MAYRYQIELEQRADVFFGLCQQRYHGDRKMLGQLEYALNASIVELREGHPSIWAIRSDSPYFVDCYVLYYPPVRIYFRKIHEGKIGIFGIEEIVLVGLPT